MNKNIWMEFKVVFYLSCITFHFPHNVNEVCNTQESAMSGACQDEERLLMGTTGRGGRARLWVRQLPEADSSIVGWSWDFKPPSQGSQRELIISPPQPQSCLLWKFMGPLCGPVCNTEKGDLNPLIWIFKWKVTPKGWKTQTHLFIPVLTTSKGWREDHVK